VSDGFSAREFPAEDDYRSLEKQTAPVARLERRQCGVSQLATRSSVNAFKPVLQHRGHCDEKLGAADDNFAYANMLTHFVSSATGALTDQVPAGDAIGFSLLRSGYLDGDQLDVVDVFGRKRPVIDGKVAADQ
jgi:hypothetical protein